MNNSYRNKGTSTKAVIVIALVSFSIPFTLHLALKTYNKKETAPAPVAVVQQPVIEEKENKEILMVLEVLKELNNNIVSNIPTQSLPIVSTETTQNLYTITSNLKQNEIKKVQWLDSPVMQTWIQDERTKIWSTALPYKESMKSSPSLRIGLREDGVVVWMKTTN
jgi:hypothetical protein